MPREEPTVRCHTCDRRIPERRAEERKDGDDFVWLCKPCLREWDRRKVLRGVGKGLGVILAVGAVIFLCFILLIVWRLKSMGYI